MFNHVREQVWRKLNTWDTKLLLAAGKEVLIKAVGQALPTYTMGVFKLPKPLCQELSAMIARHFEAFNKAMVAKQAWRILENPTSLVAKILKARYFPDDDFVQASFGSSPSLIWRSILWGCEVIEGGLLWRVGNGVSIRVLQDSLDDRDVIASIPLGSVSQWGDSRYWFFSKNGKYSVNTGYRVVVRQCDEDFGVGGSDQRTSEGFWMRIWKLAVPNKIKMLLWRCRMDILPTVVNLVKRRVLTSFVCARCDRGLGGCFRDHDGNFICGFAAAGPPGLDVLSTELVAVREGLLMMGYMGFSRFTIRLDSQEAVSILKDGRDWWGNVGNVVEDVHCLMVD
ncbi:unnamed protein product, partial [Prunus brigantina]